MAEPTRVSNNSSSANADYDVLVDTVTDPTLGTGVVQLVKIMDGTIDGTTKAAVGTGGLKVDPSGVTSPVSVGTEQATAADTNGTLPAVVKVGGAYDQNAKVVRALPIRVVNGEPQLVVYDAGQRQVLKELLLVMQDIRNLLMSSELVET